jgi:hypothetical protein
VATQPFAIFGIKNNFHKTIRITRCLCFTRCAERKFTYFDIVAFFACCFFCKPYRSNFRCSIRTARYVAIIYRVYVKACYFFNTGNTFSRCYVG